MDITLSEEIDPEFLEIVQCILDDAEFKKLNYYKQHLKTTRFMHSLNVSYVSWLLAKRFGKAGLNARLSEFNDNEEGYTYYIASDARNYYQATDAANSGK